MLCVPCVLRVHCLNVCCGYVLCVACVGCLLFLHGMYIECVFCVLAVCFVCVDSALCVC